MMPTRGFRFSIKFRNPSTNSTGFPSTITGGLITMHELSNSSLEKKGNLNLQKKLNMTVPLNQVDAANAQGDLLQPRKIIFEIYYDKTFRGQNGETFLKITCHQSSIGS